MSSPRRTPVQALLHATGAVLIASSMCCGRAKESNHPGSTASARVDSAAAMLDTTTHAVPTPDGSVTQTEFRNVNFHVGNDIVLRIRALRGEMRSRKAGAPVIFDDKRSFVINIASAEVALDMESLGHLMNEHVFAYAGAPLRKLQFSVVGNQLRQKGIMHKGIDIPFQITSTLSVTDSGMIRIHPTGIEAFSIGSKRLMSALGLKLSGMIDLSKARGIRVEKNDLILDPEQLLPPPEIRGRLTGVRIESQYLVQTFGSAAQAAKLPKISPARSDAPNYMFFRHGTLQFGKLLMLRADMQIVDEDTKDPFEFNIDSYNDQLVAGYSKNQPDMGLVVYMPDLGETRPKKTSAASPRS